MLENVPAILVRGLGRVLSDLAEIGYNAFWDCIRASDLGALHRRDRWFLVAYPKGERSREARQFRCNESKERVARGGKDVADAIGGRQSGPGQSFNASNQETGGKGQAIDALNGCFGNFWAVEPNVGRVANGVPNRTHRLAALGNAIVPLWAFLVSKVAIAIYDQQEALR
jgi:DNA (cytosine-5)-methyltransferase 1